MDQGSTRRFDDSHAMPFVNLVGVENVGAEDVLVFTKYADSLDRKQNFNQPGVVIIEGVFHWLAFIETLESFQFFICQRSLGLFGEVQASQWTDAIHTFGIS